MYYNTWIEIDGPGAGGAGGPAGRRVIGCEATAAAAYPLLTTRTQKSGGGSGVSHWVVPGAIAGIDDAIRFSNIVPISRLILYHPAVALARTATYAVRGTRGSACALTCEHVHVDSCLVRSRFKKTNIN